MCVVMVCCCVVGVCVGCRRAAVAVCFCLFRIEMRCWVRPMAAVKGFFEKVGVCGVGMSRVCLGSPRPVYWGLGCLVVCGATSSTIMSMLSRRALYACVRSFLISWVRVGIALSVVI